MSSDAILFNAIAQSIALQSVNSLSPSALNIPRDIDAQSTVSDSRSSRSDGSGGSGSSRHSNYSAFVTQETLRQPTARAVYENNSEQEDSNFFNSPITKNDLVMFGNFYIAGIVQDHTLMKQEFKEMKDQQQVLLSLVQTMVFESKTMDKEFRDLTKGFLSDFKLNPSDTEITEKAKEIDSLSEISKIKKKFLESIRASFSAVRSELKILVLNGCDGTVKSIFEKWMHYCNQKNTMAIETSWRTNETKFCRILFGIYCAVVDSKVTFSWIEIGVSAEKVNELDATNVDSLKKMVEVYKNQIVSQGLNPKSKKAKRTATEIETINTDEAH
jgi:hypothetical protein